MSVNLAELKGRLEADVPQYDEVPSDSQYSQAVRDAVANFSLKVPHEKFAQIVLVSGTATYDLPGDFASLIQLESLSGLGEIIHTGDGLVPISAEWEQHNFIEGLTITFVPTPTFGMTLDLRYNALHVLSASDVYEDMTAEEAGTVMLQARVIVLQLQAIKASQQALSYAIGDERISKEKLAGALRDTAAMLDQRYKERCQEMTRGGMYGTRASYAPIEYPPSIMDLLT